MKRLLRYAKKEWEQAALAVTALLCALVLLSWLFGGNTDRKTLESRPMPEHQRAFGERAFAFLDESADEAPLQRNPFRFEIRASSAPEAVAEPEVEANATTDIRPPRRSPRPAAEETPDTSAGQESEAVPAAPAPPTSRLVPCDLTFVFYNVNTSGKPVALLELRNPARASASPLAKTVGVGETLYGMKVVKVEADTLYVLDAAGRRHQIDLGEQQRIAIRVKP